MLINESVQNECAWFWRSSTSATSAAAATRRAPAEYLCQPNVTIGELRSRFSLVLYLTYRICNHQNLDVTSIITQRLNAMRKLQDNPHDSDAMRSMNNAQKDVSFWNNICDKKMCTQCCSRFECHRCHRGPIPSSCPANLPAPREPTSSARAN